MKKNKLTWLVAAEIGLLALLAAAIVLLAIKPEFLRKPEATKPTVITTAATTEPSTEATTQTTTVPVTEATTEPVTEPPRNPPPSRYPRAITCPLPVTAPWAPCTSSTASPPASPAW